MENIPENNEARRNRFFESLNRSALVIGVSVGVALGLALNNPALGIAIGIAIYSGQGAVQRGRGR